MHLRKAVYILSLIIVLIAAYARTVCAAEDLLKSADNSYKAKDYGKAEEIYREVYINNKKGPLSERSLFGMASADFKLKRYTEARLNLQRFLLVYPKSVYVNEAFFIFGYILMYGHKLDDAEHYFELVGGPLKAKADIGRAEVALGRGDIAAAESIIGTGDKKELESNPRALYVKAAIFSKKGMYKDAVATIKKVFDISLREEDLRVEKALIFFAASQFNDAEKLCKYIIADPVGNSEKQKAQKILARVYEREGKVDEALQRYVDIPTYEMDDNVKMSLAGLYDKKGDSGNALKYVSLLKDKKAQSEEIEKRLGQLIAARDPKALEYLLKFSSLIDKDNPFIVTVARYLIDNGKKLEGESMLRKAESGLERGEADLLRAKVLMSDGKYIEARKIVTPLLFENRYFIRASFIVAEILSTEGDPEGAIACMEKAEKYSNDFRITSMIADLYLQKGDRETAFKYYKISSDKGDAIAALKAGDLLYLSGKASQAGAYYKRSLGLGLSDKKSLQWAYYQYGKMTGNKEYLNKAERSGGVVGQAAGILSGR